MAEIKINYNAWSLERLAQGRKFCTSRRQKYGQAGDTFRAESHTYELQGHVHLPLWFILRKLYQLEGADSPEELEAVWKSIHPKAPMNLEEKFWVHFFTRGE